VVSKTTNERDTEMTNRTKIAALALTALVGLGAVATPVLADGSFDSSYYLTQLRYDGINAIAAQEVNGDQFQATVVTADGHTVFQLFDKDSLQIVKQ
jgi:hypothetical protein